MKLRITFYAEPRDVHPLILANPTGDFESLESARKSAFEDAGRPTMQAHSIIIATVDDSSVEEHWARDGKGTGRAASRPLIAGFAGKTSAPSLITSSARASSVGWMSRPSALQS